MYIQFVNKIILTVTNFLEKKIFQYINMDNLEAILGISNDYLLELGGLSMGKVSTDSDEQK